MASLGGLKRDTAFHLSLGSTFAKIRTRQHLLSAVCEFEHAVELTEDPELIWLAYQNKADVLSALGEFKDAIAAASSALGVLPEHRFYNKHRLFRLISDANLHLGNRDTALEAAVKAWESAPNDPAVAFCLYDKSRPISSSEWEPRPSQISPRVVLNRKMRCNSYNALLGS